MACTHHLLNNLIIYEFSALKLTWFIFLLLLDQKTEIYMIFKLASC